MPDCQEAITLVMRCKLHHVQSKRESCGRAGSAHAHVGYDSVFKSFSATREVGTHQKGLRRHSGGLKAHPMRTKEPSNASHHSLFSLHAPVQSIAPRTQPTGEQRTRTVAAHDCGCMCAGSHLMVRQMSQPPPTSAKPEHTKSSSDAATMRGVQLKVPSGGVEAAAGVSIPSGADAAAGLTCRLTAAF